MRRQLVYDESFFETPLAGEQDDTLGFAFLAPLIGAAPGIFSSIMGLFGGGRKAQYQGLAEIQQAGNQAVGAMEEILQRLGKDLSPQQAVEEAKKIVQQFNDPTIVYPAKKGADATARTNFISQLADLSKQIQAKAASIPANNPNAAGAAAGSIGGISTNTLLLGLAALFLLKKD